MGSDEIRMNRLTWQINKCAFKVHNALGPGLLESVYGVCMVHELREAGFRVEREVAVPIVYGNVKLECGYRLDVLVEGTVVLELKALEKILPVHGAQLLTYLKLTGKPIGLLLNFNVPHMKDGIVRKINTF